MGFQVYEFIAIVMSVIYAVSSQKWISPTNLNVYAINGTEITISWKFDNQNEVLKFAKIVLVDDNNQPVKSLIIWDSNEDDIVFTPSEVSTNTSFGSVTFLSIDQSEHRKISFEIEFIGLKILVDYRTFIFVDSPPIFETKTPSLISFKENQANTTDLNFTVSVISNLKPVLIWTLNNVNITDISKFSVTCNSSMNASYVVNCTLKVSKILPIHNGSLLVVAKYGGVNEQSIESVDQMDIDIKFRPYSATLTANLSMEYPFILEETVVNLTCNVIANPRPTFMFYKPFESEKNGLLYSGPNSSIQVGVKKSSLSKFLLFSCLAGSNYGNASRAMLEIFVPSERSVTISNADDLSTSSIRENSALTKNVTFKFRAISLPQVKMSCFLNNQNLSLFEEFKITNTIPRILRNSEKVYYEMMTSIEIKDLTVEYNGVLSCRALFHDSMESITVYRTIDVQYPPKAVTFTSNLTNDNIISKKTYVQFTCKAQANPNVTYALRSQYDLLYYGKEETFTKFFSNDQLSSLIKVQCSAINKIGELSSDIISLRFNNETMLKREEPKKKEEPTRWTIYMAIGLCTGVLVVVVIIALVFYFEKRQRGGVAFS